MKILYVTSGPENVGTFFRAFFFAREMVKSGNEVCLLSSHSSPNKKIKIVKERDGVKVQSYIRTRTKWDYVGFLIRSSLYAIHALANNYDVVHVFIPWQPPSLSIVLFTKLKKIFGSKTKLILDWDDYWGGDGISIEHNTILNRAITYIEGRVNFFADHVTVCSDFLKDKCVEEGINECNIFKIYNGSDTSAIYPIDKDFCRSKLKLTTNGVSCLIIGQFQTTAFPKIIKLILDCSNEDRNIKLFILGSLPVEYINLIAGHEDSIEFLGKVNHSDLKYYFSAVDFLILPMDKTSVEMARFPIRFGDYIASGTPVLAAPHGEIERLIDATNCCIKFDLDSPADFARKVDLIRCEEYSIEYSSKALKLAQRNSWTSLAKDMLKVYHV